jgi:hypothetical protein
MELSRFVLKDADLKWDSCSFFLLQNRKTNVAYYCLFVCLFVCFWLDSNQWARASSVRRFLEVRVSSVRRFLDHTQRLTTVGRTSQDKWSARRRNLYLTTHNTNNKQTSIPPARYEPKIPASERPRNYALDRADKKPAFNIVICIICVMC